MLVKAGSQLPSHQLARLCTFLPEVLTTARADAKDESSSFNRTTSHQHTSCSTPHTPPTRSTLNALRPHHLHTIHTQTLYSAHLPNTWPSLSTWCSPIPNLPLCTATLRPAPFSHISDHTALWSNSHHRLTSLSHLSPARMLNSPTCLDSRISWSAHSTPRFFSSTSRPGPSSSTLQGPLTPQGSPTTKPTAIQPADPPLSAASLSPSSSSELPALPTYDQLVAMEQMRLSGKAPQVLDTVSKAVVGRILRTFCSSGVVQDKARIAHISTDLFPRLTSTFRKFLLRAMTAELRDALVMWGSLGPEAEELLFSYLLQYTSQHYTAEVSHYAALVASSDMRQPDTWYPFARALTRKIIYHAGPTNSGKTYEALLALKAADTGVYCGPLRLLAMEVYDQLNAEGVWCNLVTGQEKSILPNAGHTACTVEMANFNRKVDVAVVDEIQCLGDEYRGYAWTRAVLGLPANEIHVCGDMSAVELVRRLCQEGGDDFEVRYYDRFSPLSIDTTTLDSGYASVQPGDCVVAFSRSRIFEIKENIERHTNHKVCIVYGALPPETRRQQALLFNDPHSSWDVLVASDAVGMGLNLNIRRIVFDSVRKKMGHMEVEIPVTSLKQIGGRAGRRNSIYSQGFVACTSPMDLKVVRSALDTPAEALHTPAAGLFPEWEQLELLAGQLPGATFAGLLAQFARTTRMDGHYFFCNQETLIRTARLLDRVPGLSLKDRYTFCLAPADSKDMEVMLALLQFAYSYAAGHPVALDVPSPERPPTNALQMRALEVTHKICSLWLWLSYRLEEGVFPGRERAIQVLASLASNLNLGLQLMTEGRSKDHRLRWQAHEADRSPHKHRMPLVTDPSQWVQGFLDKGALLDPQYRKFVRLSGSGFS